MSTYLVTGACGFIGSNFVHYALRREPRATVVALDNLSFAANEPNLDAVRDRIRFVVGDICDFDGMTRVYERFTPDFVVNFAAESHNDRAVVDPSSFARTNALGAQTLLEVSRRRPVRRHVHVSTIEVYGELAEGARYFDESSPLNAKTPYSAAKAAGDQFVRAYLQKLLLFRSPSFGYSEPQRNGDVVIVGTRIVSPKDEYHVDYEMRERDGQWMATDVIVEGISLTDNYRSQFASLLRDRSFKELLDLMRRKTRPAQAESP